MDETAVQPRPMVVEVEARIKTKTKQLVAKCATKLHQLSYVHLLRIMRPLLCVDNNVNGLTRDDRQILL